MGETASVLIPALLALAGTLIATLFVYVQWRVSHRHTTREAYIAKRQAAYNELWDVLEATHVDLRLGKLNAQNFTETVRTLNTFLLKQAPFIDQQDTRLARQYLDTLFRVDELIRDKGGEVWVRRWGDTEALGPPPDYERPAPELATAHDEALRLGFQLQEKVRRVLSGDAV